MAVMLFKMRPLLLALCLWALAPPVFSRECDVNLMKHFHLVGSKFPVKLDMDVCGRIEDNCCAPEDELRIYTLWNEFSVMKVNRYISEIFKKYTSIIAAHQEIIEVSTDLIETKRVTLKTIPYKFKVCERTTLLEDLMDPEYSKIDLLNHNKILDIPGFDARKLKRGDFKIKGSLKRFATDDKGSPFGHRAPKSRRLSNRSRPQRFLEKTDTSSGKRHLIGKSKSHPFGDLLDKKLDATLASDNKKHFNGSRRMVIHQKIDLDAPAARQTKDKPAKPAEIDFTRDFVFDEELPARHVDCTTSTKLIHKEVTTENNFKKQYCMNLKQKIVGFRIDDFQDYIAEIKVPMLKLIETKKSFYCTLCDNSLQKYIDSGNKIVSFDQEFCRSLVWEYRDYLKFQNIIFVEYVDMIIQYIRCFQTTADEKVFPYPNFLNTFKSQFSYIEGCISHIDSPNFMEHCIYICDKYSYTGFSSFWDGNPDFLSKVMFLITSFLRKVKSSQPLTVDYQGIEEELKTVENVDFDNPFYEKGHHKKRELKLKEIKDLPIEKKGKKMSTKKKLRKLAYELKDRDIEAENEAKKEHAKVMIEALKNLSKPSGDFREIEEAEHTSVYDLRESTPNLKSFHSKFVKDKMAIDPIHMEKNLNFAAESVSVLEKKCDNEKKRYGELDQVVVLEYFSFTTNEIDHFQKDLFLSFADYSLFQ